MRYLLTGGGTGGHVYPALAVADELRRQQEDAEFLYVGTRDRLESRVVPGRGYALSSVSSSPFPRSRSLLALARFGWSVGLGVLKAAGLLLRFRPHVIIGTGGYVSAPILFAHGLLRKVGLSRSKVFLYEPNAHPGLLNLAVGRLADRIGLAFEQAGRWFDMKRVAIVGFPVRREVLEVERAAARRRLGIGADKQVVLACGGSGGARAINEAVVEALPQWRARREELLVLHVTGRYRGPDYDAVRGTEAHLRRLGLGEDVASWYRRFDYMDNLQDAYGAADLAICRGGAATLTELCARGLPALVVPLAAAAEDHQAMNARELERAGAAEVLYQEAYWDGKGIGMRVDAQVLAARVLSLLDAPERRRRMGAAGRAIPRKDSLELILREIENLVRERRPAPLNLEFPERQKGVPADPNALLLHVRRSIDEAGGVEGLDPRELSYLRYQADRLLVSDAWYEIPLGRRNVGVKLAGYLQCRQHLPLLLHILRDRRPVGFLHRLFGGDFCHGGLLRRNVIEYGICLLGVADGEVEKVLIETLRHDPYFEVRAAAAQALGALYAPAPHLEAALIEALDDRAARVVMRALGALGRLGRGGGLLQQLHRFYLHPDWQFRREVVRAMGDLQERGVLSPEEVAGELKQILAISPYFDPKFPLTDELRQLAERLRRARLQKAAE